MAVHDPKARLLDTKRSVLVLVDYQERLMPAIHAGERVTAEASVLAAVARRLGIRVVGTAQSPDSLGPNVASIRQYLDACVEKTRFDACADGLADFIDTGDPAGSTRDGSIATPSSAAGEPETKEIVIAGCEAHVCLLQTALSLVGGGRRVWVVASACGSRRPSDHRLAMERLRDAGAQVVSTEMVCFEWLRDSRNPAFRDVLHLVKSLPLDVPPETAPVPI